jgi:L-cystine transport system substrate-binding protein
VKWFRHGLVYLLGLMILVQLTGCSVQTDGDLLSQIEGTYKPFSFHDPKTNQLTGFDVEVAQEVAKRLGVKAEFVEIPWDGLLTSLQTGKIDMVANQVGIKPERQKKFDFSKPYTISYAQLVVHQDNQTIRTLEDIKGKKAGQTPTSNYGKMAEEHGAQIVAYEDMMGAMQDVAAKRIDLSLNDKLAIAEMLKNNDLPLKVIDIQSDRAESAFPVQKGNAELVKAINKALDEMEKDGTLIKISKKWFGTDVTK